MKDFDRAVATGMFFFVLIVLVLIFVHKASVERQMKSFSSEYSGGLNRVVTVYDYNGDEITSYTGKIDIEETETPNKVKFDLDGKRTVVYGGIVVVQEQ